MKKRVDLSKVETGKPVEFTLKQGRDKTYRALRSNPNNAGIEN